MPTESLPIRNTAEKIPSASLAIFSAVSETPIRARSVRGTRHSVTVADAGSNPVGSILPVVEEKFHLRREGRDISSSNLTLACHSPILSLTECLTLRFFSMVPPPRGHSCFTGSYGQLVSLVFIHHNQAVIALTDICLTPCEDFYERRGEKCLRLQRRALNVSQKHIVTL